MKKNKMRLMYLLENEIQYSKEERNAFLESLKKFSQYKNEIFRESKEIDERTGRPMRFSERLKHINEEIGKMVEGTEIFTMGEADWFDATTKSKDLKQLKNDYNLFSKSCMEMVQLQQRLESLYEDMGGRLSRYYDL